MKQILIVVDMQNDVITGALGSEQAKAIVPKVAQKVHDFQGEVIFTRDTHEPNYLSTQEGRLLPVEHCVRGSEGWQICPEVAAARDLLFCRIFDKGAFGSKELAQMLAAEAENISGITLVGLCTDICVISNAMLLKAFLPEVPISVDTSCCAGVTEESHRTALDAMRACQVNIIEKKEE